MFDDFHLARCDVRGDPMQLSQIQREIGRAVVGRDRD